MVNIKNKKGAVELSLNLIIMLVIGLTVLGLIIAFVTSFLGSAEDSFKGKLTEDDKTKIEQVERETGNFAFLSSTVNVIQGSDDPGKLYVKIRNPTNGDFTYTTTGDGEGVSENSGDGIGVVITAGMINGETYENSGENKIRIFSPPITLAQGESAGYSLEVYAGNNVPIGTYYAKFTLDLGNENTYEQVVTIKVE